ncbi:MAG: ribosome silencing factor [Prevotellaceae bacterium]|jgi:ribosome-associated protein|nr:ribosome silencing factor [Prevotellaceae bacterium]
MLKKYIDTNTKVAKIVEGIQELKGKRIVTVDMTELGDAPCSYFVICQGDSNTHVNSITSSVRRWVREKIQVRPQEVDGLENCRWVAMDYGEIIVHIFQRSDREFYDLENLWLNARLIWYEDVA